MRLPRKWLLGMAVAAALPQAVMAQQLSTNSSQAVSQTDSARTNKAIAQDIAQAMRTSGLTGQKIQIEVKGGVAVIRGLIGDASQKATVSQLASAVAGVQSVSNELIPMEAAPVQTAAFEAPASAPSQVQPVAAEQASTGQPAAMPQVAAAPMPAAPTKRGNQAVAQDIAQSLTSVGLDKYDIEIRHKNGVCTLIGAVSQQGEALQAAYVAQAVAGVERVDNKLTIAGSAPIQQTAGQGYGRPMPQMMPPQMAQQMPPQMAQQMAGRMPAGQPVHPAAAYGPQGGLQPTGHHMNPGVYNRPALPEYAWPAYAAHDNYAAVTYPSQYDASAFPYIGPFYPYPQVPLGWRSAELEWDDGYWNLEFDSRTDKWWWFLNPQNWK